MDIRSEDPFAFVSLNVSNLASATEYWRDILGMREMRGVPGAASEGAVMLAFGEDQTRLELVERPGGGPIEHGSAFGR